MGIKHFCAGNDLRILFGWYQDQSEKVRDLFDKA
jgi:hypothetical protein